MVTKVSTKRQTVRAFEFPLFDLFLDVCCAIFVELGVKVLRENLILIPPALDVIYDAVSKGMAAAVVCLIKYLIDSVGVFRIVEGVKIPAIVAATH